MRSILTIIGADRVGIIARVAGILSGCNINILDIDQTVMREYFTMIMLVDMTEMSVSFDELNKKLAEAGKELGLCLLYTSDAADE